MSQCCNHNGFAASETRWTCWLVIITPPSPPHQGPNRDLQKKWVQMEHAWLVALDVREVLTIHCEYVHTWRKQVCSLCIDTDLCAEISKPPLTCQKCARVCHSYCVPPLTFPPTNPIAASAISSRKRSHASAVTNLWTCWNCIGMEMEMEM